MIRNLSGRREFNIIIIHKGNGRKELSPEADSLRWRLSKVAECSYHIAPSVKCFLGENGYDKSPSSRQSTPLIPGLSAAQSQGIMLTSFY